VINFDFCNRFSLPAAEFPKPSYLISGNENQKQRLQWTANHHLTMQSSVQRLSADAFYISKKT